MNLAEVIELIWGSIEQPHRQRRALFVGAGLTKATYGNAPLFKQYNTRLKRELVTLGYDPVQLKWAEETTDFLELLLSHRGRRAVAELLVSEPVVSEPKERGLPCLQPGAYCDAFDQSPLPPAYDATFRQFDSWRNAVEQGHAVGNAAVTPSAPPLLIGRLLAEGAVDSLVTTNWDTYLELGAWLAGLDVRLTDEATADTRLAVVDTSARANTSPRMAGIPHLYKLHGSIDRLAEDCSDFLATSADLISWEGAGTWISDLIGDQLRSHHLLFLGVSGTDPVVYHAVRKHLSIWEQSTTDKLAPPPIAAVDWSGGIRLRSMLTRHAGAPQLNSSHCMNNTNSLTKNDLSSDTDRLTAAKTPVVAMDAAIAVRCIYAWVIASRLAPHLAEVELHTLKNMLRGELKAHKAGLLTQLLCYAVGPSLRIAALASGRLVHERRTSVLSLTRYAAWRDLDPCRPCMDTSRLRSFAEFVVHLAKPGRLQSVDADTGRVTIKGNRVFSLHFNPWPDVTPGAMVYAFAQTPSLNHPFVGAIGTSGFGATELLMHPPWDEPAQVIAGGVLCNVISSGEIN